MDRQVRATASTPVVRRTPPASRTGSRANGWDRQPRTAAPRNRLDRGDRARPRGSGGRSAADPRVARCQASVRRDGRSLGSVRNPSSAASRSPSLRAVAGAASTAITDSRIQPTGNDREPAGRSRVRVGEHVAVERVSEQHQCGERDDDLPLRDLDLVLHEHEADRPDRREYVGDQQDQRADRAGPAEACR